MNIVIVGFMGTGKTSVAVKLSEKLNMQYMSTDDLIEQRENRSISDIFAKDGEAYFRNVEHQVVKDISQKDNLIIDTGGGVVINPENIKNLRKNSKLVCLTATPDVIYSRTKSHSHRPLLNIQDPVGKIRDLLVQREKFYSLADIMIDTNNKNVEQIIKEIEKKLSL